ncbi:hypothetical protein AB0L59_00220, partial [Streptomyces sp. NPDC052109]|uniref:hypothetical protein n=1 Tax=Streptomyces sp. NPDC052109 TaxID=3155527 RepID=UPI0034376386
AAERARKEQERRAARDAAERARKEQERRAARDAAERARKEQERRAARETAEREREKQVPKRPKKKWFGAKASEFQVVYTGEAYSLCVLFEAQLRMLPGWIFSTTTILPGYYIFDAGQQNWVSFPLGDDGWQAAWVSFCRYEASLRSSWW